MASTGVEVSISLLDDPKHLKNFFSKAKSTPVKSYRVGAVATSEVVPKETYVHEETNGAASPVLSAASKAPSGKDQIGEAPTMNRLKIDEPMNAGGSYGSDPMTLPHHDTQAADVDAHANSGFRSPVIGDSIQADGTTFASYGLGKAPFTTPLSTFTNGNAHDANLAAGTDIDSPAHKKNFFKSARANGNAFGSHYTPCAAHEHGEASHMEEETHGGEADQTETRVAALPETEKSSTVQLGHHETILHSGNGAPSGKFFESPRASGLVAPPPTPESPALADKAINVPATIVEQPSGSPDLNNGLFTLSQSVHAPPHLRMSSKVQKKHNPSENYGSFERQSFKVVDDEATNGVTPTDTKTEKSGNDMLKDPITAKALPPHLRGRPTNVGVLRTSRNADKPTINPVPAEVAPVATKFHSADPKILGIYAHDSKGSKESAQLTPNVAPGAIEKPAEKPSAAYQPPHKRASANVPNTLAPTINKESTAAAKPYALNNTNGGAYTSSSAKEAVSGKNDMILGTTWGKPLPRDSGPARHRKVILKGLPEYSTPAFAACLVWGGPIEEIVVTGSGNQAFATFMHAEDCAAYFKATSNDVKYTANGQQCYVTVTLDNDVNPPSGGLKTAIEKEFTRSVRLIGVEESYGLGDVWALASNKGRKVESIENGKTARGARQIVVNFCNVYDAIKFRSDLNRDENWEHINIGYQGDSCADATGVRNLDPSPDYMVKRLVAQAF